MIDFLKQTFGDAVTDEVLTSFKNELGKKFVAKADYNTKRDELKNAREKLSELENENNDFREKIGLFEERDVDIQKLQEKYDQHVSVLNGKIEQMRLDGELDALIRKNGGKNEKALKALLELGDENIIENATEQLECLKKSVPYLFDTPAQVGNRGNFPRSKNAPQQNLTYSQMMQLESNQNF